MDAEPANDNDTPPAFPGNWVRIMCDYCADPVWEADGCMGSLNALPVSEDLRSALGRWSDKYHLESPTQGETWLGRAAFSETGLLLARRVKAELPHWNVIYFDEQKLFAVGRDVSRTTYEYEIQQDGE